MRVIQIKRRKVDAVWRYDVPSVGVDANQCDPETERAIIALFRSKLGEPPDTVFEVIEA